jgi:hypothetical protein
MLFLIIFVWIYKFNYLSNLEWYNVDGNKIQDTNNAELLILMERKSLPVDPVIIDEIAVIYPDIEGIDCVWSINEKDTACVLINQIDFEWLSKVVIFQIKNDLTISNMKEYPQNPGESVNFVCGSSCYPSDFWFEWDWIFKYKWHDLISPDVIYTIKY